MAANKVTDHFRAAARVQHLIDEAKKTSPLADEEDAVKKQELEERRSEIRSVMEELPEQHRLALEWKYVDKLSVREIAGRMGTTEKAVESVLFRARREFRQRVMKVDQESEQQINGNGSSQLPSNSGTSSTSGTSGDGYEDSDSASESQVAGNECGSADGSKESEVTGSQKVNGNSVNGNNGKVNGRGSLKSGETSEDASASSSADSNGQVTDASADQKRKVAQS